MASNPVVHFEIPAKDVKKMRSFYESVFDWKFARVGDYWTIDTGGLRGGLLARTSPAQAPLNFVRVEAIGDALEKITSRGGRVQQERAPVPALGWFAIAIDPEGNAIGLWQDDPLAS